MITALVMALAAAATPGAPPKEVSVSGGFLVTQEGAPLYTYANDTMVGMSHCGEACAKDHPPLLAPAGAAPSGDWTLVGRDDGSYQWAFHDKPLYTSMTSPGEGSFWARAASNGVVTAAAAPARSAGAFRLSRADSSQFTCEGDRRLLAQFISRDASSTAIVDTGEGAYTLTLMPWTGGEPQVSWSDGRRTLVWTTGVKLMWMDGPDHLACGRAAHHH